MRLFIAVDIDARIRKEIDRIQRDLQRKTGWSKGPVKWVQPDLIHLTLKFLGEVRDDAVTEVCRIAEETARAHPGFEMTVSGLGISLRSLMRSRSPVLIMLPLVSR